MNKNLVNLEGTEKQVSYAEQIRWSLFGGLIDLCESEEKEIYSYQSSTKRHPLSGG